MRAIAEFAAQLEPVMHLGCGSHVQSSATLKGPHHSVLIAAVDLALDSVTCHEFNKHNGP